MREVSRAKTGQTSRLSCQVDLIFGFLSLKFLIHTLR